MSVVAVTGASVKTGRTVVEQLTTAGFEVRAIDSTGPSACRLALEAPVSGVRSYVIAADDTLMTPLSAELVEQLFPGVPVRERLEPHRSPLSNRRARGARLPARPFVARQGLRQLEERVTW